MTKPDPSLGLVIRYDYLWRDEEKRGRTEGAKDRPCAVVVATSPPITPPRALVAAITHTKPENNQGVEIPPRVKQHLGLDTERSWIIISEVNEIHWTDPGIIPVSAERWEYGFLPQMLAQTVLDAIRALDARKTIPIVKRKF